MAANSTPAGRHLVASADFGHVGSLVIGPVTIDLDGFVIRGPRGLQPLALQEYLLLRILLRNAGQVVPTRDLLDYGWGGDPVSPQSIKVHVYRLRNKLQDIPAPCPLRTIRGIGYIFDRVGVWNPAPPDDQSEKAT